MESIKKTFSQLIVCTQCVHTQYYSKIEEKLNQKI